MRFFCDNDDMKLSTSIFQFISYRNHQTNSLEQLFKVVRLSDLQEGLY